MMKMKSLGGGGYGANARRGNRALGGYPHSINE